MARKRSAKRRVAKKRTCRKKVLKKAPVRRAKKAARPLVTKPQAKVIGIVTHYFPKVNAAVIKLKSPLQVGETIKIKGHTTDFTQPVESMQIDHVVVNSAKKGAEIGLLVGSRVRQHDIVYKA